MILFSSLCGLLRYGGCGRLMSTHTTIRTGHSRLLSMSIHGGRVKACKGVIISAYDIETAVLSEIGADPKLTSKEQQAAVRKAE